jgi:hypothetical protein
VSYPVHASGTRRATSRRVWLAVRRPSVRRRTWGQRNRHRLVPASSGAKAPLACEDRQLVGCARASITVAEVGERRRGPEKRDSPSATGHVDGDQSPRVSARILRGPKSVGRQHRGGQAVELEQAGAGRPKGRRGAKVFARWKAPRVVSPSVSFTRADRRRPRRPSRGSVHARASRGTRGRRQGCQRFGSHAPRREDNAHRGETRGDRATHRSELLCRAADNLSSCAGAKASDAAETNEARVPIRRREMAEVGPTHRASQRRGAARRAGGAKLAEEHPHDVLTHPAAVSRRERCEGGAAIPNHGKKRRP